MSEKETRKSDFTGDYYGQWVVVGRAPAINRKRAWVVQNGDGDTKVVLQTELAGLGDKIYFDSGGENPLIARLAAPEVANPWAQPGDVGHGECRHGRDIRDCAEDSALVGKVGQEALEKYKPRSLQIAESVIAASEPAKAEVAAGAEEVASDWSYGLPADGTYVDPTELIGGIGAAAEEAVTEASLDERAPTPDPLRKAIRTLMGQISDARINVATLGAQLDVLMELADDTLRAAIVR